MRTERPGATDRDFERETVIQWDDGYEEASVYTLHPALQGSLIRRGLKPVETGTHNGRVRSMTFYVPRSWVSVRPPRQLTEADRQAKGRRLAAANSARSSLRGTTHSKPTETTDPDLGPGMDPAA